MAATDVLGPLAKLTRRKTPFQDEVGMKDASGKGINLIYWKNKYYTAFGADRFDSVKTAKIRPDDLLVCGYPKTGCHWIWETIVMILKGKAEYASYLKLETFLEMSIPEMYDPIQSPRVLNTHVEYQHLPDQAKELKTKIIMTYRNPKDTAISFYNHHINLREIYNYDGQFHDWFQLFVNGKVDFGDFFDYHVSWEKAINENPDHPILIVKYEDTKRDTHKAIRTIADFINVTLTDDQVNDIARGVDFGAMKKKFENQATEKLIRKGEVGDWKNWLTDEEETILDNKARQYFTGTRFEPLYD